MKKLYIYSGPCGCGKTTLSNAWAQHLISSGVRNQICVIHGDDFHASIAETDRSVGPDCPGFLYWPDSLAFNWDCMLSVARNALSRGLDVVLDYVVEDELPLIVALAKEQDAALYYVVVTADAETIRSRLQQRGDQHLTERAMSLKTKLESMPENQRHLLNNTDKSVTQQIASLDIEQYQIIL